MSNGKGMIPRKGYSRKKFSDNYDAVFSKTVTSQTRYCPVCKTDWKSGDIPEKSKHLYAGDFFSRLIGLYDMGSDRTVAWQCPDCKNEFKR